MTKILEETTGMSEPDAKVLQDIREFGWHVTGVFGKQGEEGSEWAFPIGLFHSFGHPELIVFGLPLQRCMNIINEIGNAVKVGKRFLSGEEYPDILADSYKCSFREVTLHQYRNYVGYALWFYEDDPFPLSQCFWPDKEGRFPWDERCNEYVKSVQPLLFAQ
jgi:hypothetical protein